MSAGGVQGEVIWGMERLWLLERGRHSFLEMILPGLWMVMELEPDLITDDRKLSELEEPELGLDTLGPPTCSPAHHTHYHYTHFRSLLRVVVFRRISLVF